MNTLTDEEIAVTPAEQVGQAAMSAIAQKEAEIEALRQQLAEKSAEAMRFETMFCSVNDDLSKLETQLAAAQEQIDINTPKAAFCELQQQLANMTERYNVRKELADHLGQQLADMTRQRDFWIGEEKLRQQETNATVQDVSNYAATLEQQLAAANTEISLLRFALADTEALELGTAERLAAIQSREQQLREALDTLARLGNGVLYGNSEGNLIAQRALTLHQDTTALSAMIAKAGEVMRERAAAEGDHWHQINTTHKCGEYIAAAIRALPGVTLEDIE